uniref:Uncharacterized protein n=1 Tax=Globisporangium ultimum (strain ATCC 200006 / CBS 805.95 / DAOM BR144) TaxID=431595 RepID=K3X620_GLOUD
MTVTRSDHPPSSVHTPSTPGGAGAASAPSHESSGNSHHQHKLKKHKDRGLKFNEKHALKYGLSVCSRNAKTTTVESVMCKFCVAFGKESASDSTRKRRATANIKYFRQPFRADHYLSHLEINHKQKWGEYEHATGPEKEKFFAAHIEETTMNSLAMAQQQHQQQHNSHNQNQLRSQGDANGDLTAQRVGPVRLPASEIERAVVELLIGEMFYSPSDEEGVRKPHALDVFVKKDGSENYEIVIKNQRLYDLAIKFVSCGASFRLASRMIQCTKEETKLAYYGGASEHKIASYVRAVLASNLQKIALMMRSSWSYAIATDAAIHQSTSYLDIRIRLWQHGSLHDFHIMTLPTFDQYPAPAIVQRLEKCLNILDSNWRAKLLGTTTNGGTNTGRNTGMTGSQQGLAARLTSLVTKPGFYLIWCGVHQLELVVKNAVTEFCQKSFYDELVAILATLRQDHHGVFNTADIPDITPTYATSRGFTDKLMQALKWLIEHRLAVTPYLQTTAPSSVPSASWWVCVAVAHRVLAEVEYFLKKLLTMESSLNLVSDQVQELCKLTLIMADVVGARRDLWETRDTEDACAAGSFLLTYQNSQQFIQNEGGPLAIEMFDTLRGVDRLHISKSVAHFVVDLIAAVATIAQEGRHYCAEDVGVLVNPPCVMPISVFEMGKEAFLKVLYAQEQRLLQTFSEDEVKSIQQEYEDFIVAVEREPILSGVLKKHGRETDVSFAWSCLNGRYKMLQEFVGGLAAVVPEAAAGTLASDLSSLNWEKPDYRQTMIDFALEGILHAKQKMKVELVDINYLHSSPPASAVNSPQSPVQPTQQAGSPPLSIGGQFVQNQQPATMDLTDSSALPMTLPLPMQSVMMQDHEMASAILQPSAIVGISEAQLQQQQQPVSLTLSQDTQSGVAIAPSSVTTANDGYMVV